MILAAGMGSRFGGDKQFTALGPHGETLMDYAVLDAARAGVERVVLIVRPESLPLIAGLRARYGSAVEVVGTPQRLDDLPSGLRPPASRTRPWGTSQAIWCTRNVVTGPFLVVNGDDFYGAGPYHALVEARRHSAGEWHLAGYPLRETLSPSGPVNRAVCRIDGNGFLTGLTEVRGITPPVDDNAIVSMNLWGLTPAIFAVIEEGLRRFLNDADLVHDEYYLPEAIAEAMAQGQAVRVLPAGSHWCGVTFPQDAPRVREQLAALAATGAYPSPLWP